MKLCCETIMKENEKIKINDYDKCYNNVYEYLKINHKINSYTIYINKNNNEKCLFEEINDEKLDFIDELIFRQNVNVKIIFKFYANSNNEANHIKKELDNIRMPLQIFSQSLYTKYMENELEELILIDHLTGVYNRHYLDNYIHKVLSISHREDKKIAFLKISIDKFKAVIDEFNHAIGDKVLKSLATILKISIRESDIIIKISEDEFLVILLNVLSEDNAEQVSQKIIDRFAEHKTIVNKKTHQTLMKTICIGISMYPKDDINSDELIRKADIALYEAKNMGRSKIFKYNEKDTHTIDLF